MYLNCLSVMKFNNDELTGDQSVLMYSDIFSLMIYSAGALFISINVK